MSKSSIRFYLALIASLLCVSSYGAEQLYYLCGPDEDGCPEGDEQYCSCIPLNVRQIGKPYCMGFDDRNCTPLNETPDCYPAFIEKTQGHCLASIFQSENEPPCPIVTKSFCERHRTYMCGDDGHPGDCRPAKNAA